MSIDKLDEQIELLRPSEEVAKGNPKEIGRYLDRFYQNIVDLLEANKNATNALIDVSGNGDWYSEVPDGNGVYPNGTWSFRVVSGTLKVQHKESGAWVDYGIWQK